VCERAKAYVVAAEIVDRQASEVVAFVRAAVNRLGLADQEVEVVLGGGVLQAGNVRLLGGIEAGLREGGPRLLVHLATARAIVRSAPRALGDVPADCRIRAPRARPARREPGRLRARAKRARPRERVSRRRGRPRGGRPQAPVAAASRSRT